MAFNSALSQGDSAIMREDMLASVEGESVVAILGDNSKCDGFENHSQRDNCGLAVNANNGANSELGGGEKRSSDFTQIQIGGTHGNSSRIMECEVGRNDVDGPCANDNQLEEVGRKHLENCFNFGPLIISNGSEKHLSLANVLGMGQLPYGNDDILPMVNELECECAVGRKDAHGNVRDGPVTNVHEQLLHLGVTIASPVADVDSLVRDKELGIMRDIVMEKELDCESEVGQTALQGDNIAFSNVVVEVGNTSSPVREVSQCVSSQKGAHH
ncbi:CoA transferase [Sesbania bispinosa]|nr:CoA transferase [Sesbania bispinosa]